MWTAALLTVLAAGAALPPADAQNTLYSDGGCRITDDDIEVNVTCTCDQKLRQTPASRPINQLVITGCSPREQDGQRQVRLSFLPEGAAAEDEFDYVLLQARSVNISEIHLRLEPVNGRPEAAQHPLQRLHVQLANLTGGLPDGALQGLPHLEHVSLQSVVTVGSGRGAARSALADLPSLRELTITDSFFMVISGGMLTRTPRLRRLRFSNNRFDFMASEAIVVENDSDAATDDGGGCSEGEDSWLEFDAMTVDTMNANTIRVRSVRRLQVTGNAVKTMYTGALNVTLSAPGACRPLIRFTQNVINSVREEAVVVENAAASPAHLELGAITLGDSALSPALRLDGAWQRRPLADLPADRFDCTCCECAGPQQLIAAARKARPSRLDTDVFVAALGSARCVRDSSKTFLEFASACVPEANLTARVAALLSPSVAWRPSPGPLLLLLPPLALVAVMRG